MMSIRVRKNEERGKAKYDWLEPYHTFSFDTYYDEKEMGFGELRVINEDIVQSGRGFGEHGHKNMEIITYVVDGELTHRDSTGAKHVMGPGGVQKMSAGRGIHHSEMNEGSVPVHLFQVWIVPNKQNVEPAYEERKPDPKARKGNWQILASNHSAPDSVSLLADAEILTTVLDPGQTIEYHLATDRRAWLQVIRGEVKVEGENLRQGDGARLWNVEDIKLVASFDGAEVILFDLA